MNATGKKRRFGMLAWRVGVIVLLAVLVLKWGVVDGYEVRGNSMQPVLEDRDSGADRVFVFKRHFDLFAPRRFDLAVFENPESPDAAQDGETLTGNLLVKRIWALAGETVLIQNGDVLLRSNGVFAPVARTLAQIESTLIPVWSLAHDASAFQLPERAGRVDDGLTLDASADEPLFVRPKDNVDDGCFDRTGARVRGSNLVRDVALRATIDAIAAGTVVELELREQGDAFVARLDAAGLLTLIRYRGPAEETLVTMNVGDLSKGEHAVCFANVDDRVILVIDGRTSIDFAYGVNTDVAGITANVPAIGVRAGSMRVRTLEILRDLYVTDDGSFGVRGQPFLVPDDAVFALGDNSGKSRDSRQFGALPTSRLVGKPFLIFLPFARFGQL